jgi:hypothetical protein
MITYKILHPKNGVLNTDCIRGQFAYEKVTLVKAKSLQNAFYCSQNDFSDEYASLNKRSTSVGDIIVDLRHEKHYFVSGVGFTEIPHTVASYIDWTNELEDLKNECELNSLENQSNEQ